MKIRSLRANECLPMSLLLLADPSSEVIESYVHRGRCFIAELNNRVAGVSVLIDTRPQTIELVNLAVTPEEQGKGIGKQLVLHAIELARSDHYKTIEVGTANTSIGQLAMYQKCGFRIVGVDRDVTVAVPVGQERDSI
ncbi:GNAT family N-acetyltransferase [Alicyclobacillus dauci]|uniref:GNAT family N-acetyltransferase n=1 Tax=Alicyclobacillus dauci TaxID=1475485 RepID=A0ABY6ZAL3_9BACL|nr:GNAT family N-acetyltransferase [Alicyclobacillus dauci]WAH39140.1 GNAT family N-acetyltransferase [Alicyclobacillus dauci]